MTDNRAYLYCEPCNEAVQLARVPSAGTIALCGEKLVGLDLGSMRDVKGEVCAKCIEVFKREAERKAEENK